MPRFYQFETRLSFLYSVQIFRLAVTLIFTIPIGHLPFRVPEPNVDLRPVERRDREMSIIPAFVSRTTPECLQPAYFTSTLFVEAARRDVTDLLERFSTALDVDAPERPAFGIFKDVWRAQGWPLAHLLVTEAPTRDAYLRTILRSFLGQS